MFSQHIPCVGLSPAGLGSGACDWACPGDQDASQLGQLSLGLLRRPCIGELGYLKPSITQRLGWARQPELLPAVPCLCAVGATLASEEGTKSNGLQGRRPMILGVSKGKEAVSLRGTVDSGIQHVQWHNNIVQAVPATACRPPSMTMRLEGLMKAITSKVLLRGFDSANMQ